jgi:hypothetical protein
VNEDEWRTSTAPRSMIRFLAERMDDEASFDRAIRLFAAACCRLMRDDELAGELGRAAIEVAERFALGLAEQEELAQSRARVTAWLRKRGRSLLAPLYGATNDRQSQIGDFRDQRVFDAESAHTAVLCALGRRHAGPAPLGASSPDHPWHAAFHAGMAGGGAVMADLLRCVVGNPFRPAALSDTWRTASVLGLAEAIYADRAFDRLPILSDALEEAGCDNAGVLQHCREDTTHARGCWVVEMILRPAR